MFKKIIVFIIALIILFFCLVLFFPKLAGKIVQNVTNEIFHSSYVSSFTSNSMLKDIIFDSQYILLTQNFTTRGEFEDEQAANILNKKLPFFKQKRSLHFIFDQTIKFGINGKEIKIEQIDKEIHLIMPPIQIISDEVDIDSIDFFKDETKGIFAQELNANEKMQLVNIKKIEREKEAIANENYIKQAKDLAEIEIRTALQNIDAIKGYSISFIWMDKPIIIEQKKG
jgi:hypothetical protein